jgi:hypothetical protein
LSSDHVGDFRFVWNLVFFFFSVVHSLRFHSFDMLNADSLRPTTELPGSGSDENTAANDTPLMPADYSKLFGEEYRVSDDDSVDLGSAGTLDISVVEEALLHLLYACASQVCFSTLHYGVFYLFGSCTSSIL